MPDTLTPVRDALDAASLPLAIFLRDDDAGWDDARLMTLLAAVARAGVAIDLAAIPLAVGEALARELRARIDDAPEQLGLHQHGYAHTNHQTEGRSCEFGSVRDAAAQRQDLMGGRDRLQQHFGHRLDAYFTPPWNRCTPDTPLLLAGTYQEDRPCPSRNDSVSRGCPWPFLGWLSSLLVSATWWPMSCVDGSRYRWPLPGSGS